MLQWLVRVDVIDEQAKAAKGRRAEGSEGMGRESVHVDVSGVTMLQVTPMHHFNSARP